MFGFYIFLIVVIVVIFIGFIISAVYRNFFDKKKVILKNSIFLGMDFKKNNYVDGIFFNYAKQVIIFRLSNKWKNIINEEKLREDLKKIIMQNLRYKIFENWKIKLIFEKTK